MRQMLAAIPLLMTLGLGACSASSTPSAPADTLAGTYALRTVNATPLPYSVQLPHGVERRYTGGRLQLRDDATYALVLDYTDFQGTDSTPGYAVQEGSYTRTNAFGFLLERAGASPLTAVQQDRSSVRVAGDPGSWVLQFRR